MARNEEGLEFSKLRREHRERFGKAYGINFGDNRPLSEHIAILKEALRTGVPAEVPKLTCSEGIVI